MNKMKNQTFKPDLVNTNPIDEKGGEEDEMLGLPRRKSHGGPTESNLNLMEENMSKAGSKSDFVSDLIYRPVEC